MNKGLLVMGFGEHFEMVASQFASRFANRRVERLPLSAEGAMEPDEALTGSYTADQWDAFAAVGPDALNFPRLSLFFHLKLKGFRLESFVHPSAVVDPSVEIGQNSYVGESAVIQPGVRIDYNSVIGARSVVGYGCRVGSSVWVGNGCIFGPGCAIGAHVVVGPGAVVADRVNVGKHSVLQLARSYEKDVPEKTFHHNLFDSPERIYV